MKSEHPNKEINPLFPALRPGPTAVSRTSRQKQIAGNCHTHDVLQKIMKPAIMKPALSILLSLYLIPAVQAEPLDERNKLAVELVELIAANKPNARPSAEDFKQDIADQIDRTIPQLKLSAKDSEVFREAALGATAGVDIDRMTKIMANAYASKLSAKELRETIVFFKTDAGKAWLRKSVAIEAEMIAQRKVLTAEVMEATRQRLTELRSRIPSDEAP